MKTIYFNLLFFSFAFSSFGQLAYLDSQDRAPLINSNEVSGEVLTTLENCPISNGIGLSECSKVKLAEIITENVEYPEPARQHGIEETCKVLFEVGLTGHVEKTMVTGCHSVFNKPIKEVLQNVQFLRPIGNQKRIHRLDLKFKITPI